MSLDWSIPTRDVGFRADALDERAEERASAYDEYLDWLRGKDPREAVDAAPQSTRQDGRDPREAAYAAYLASLNPTPGEGSR